MIEIKMMFRNKPLCNNSLWHIVLIFITLFYIGCGEKEKPPFFTAQVIDIWNQTIVVENFKVFFWWEERGETPFLKPYEHHAKELIVEVMVPVLGDNRRVTIVAKTIPLQDIDWFAFIPGTAESTIQIRLKNAEEVVATDRFPQMLKKGENTGIADHKIFIEGMVAKGEKREQYKLELDKIKKVSIVKVAM